MTLKLNALLKQGCLRLCAAMGLLISTMTTVAAPVPSHVKSIADLNYGVVLYDYFQEHYFDALIEHEYNSANANTLALAPSGQVLKGGMMLSYGMPTESQKLFNTLLGQTTSQEISNRAWYYLAKIYYNKSEIENARAALARIQGVIPDNIFFDYYYLSTLLGKRESVFGLSEKDKSLLSSSLPGYPYLLFNIGISHLREGDTLAAVKHLNKVSRYGSQSEELSVLADRAKNGLAQLAMEAGQLDVAWTHLTDIRTTGLYSNRALLAYAWSAIAEQRYNQAIPALQMLGQRSIAIPEVQETKVLLAYLYEQQSLADKALQENITAEKQFAVGMNDVTEARRIIEGLDVPREFVKNLEAIMSKSDWYATTPSVDYEKLTPFLIDLMASNAFNEVLKELADLYSIRDNLLYWIDRSNEHEVILDNAANKLFDQELADFIQQSKQLKNQLKQKKAELRLYTLTLDEKDQERMTALLETTETELAFLTNKIEKLSSVESAYKQPETYRPMVADHHRRLQAQLVKTEAHIDALEPIMRKLVNQELDKHEKRMRYYWAQSRLAKARLYDSKLLSAEKAAPELSQLSNQQMSSDRLANNPLNTQNADKVAQ